MNLTITKPFGSITFTADTNQKLIEQSSFFASLPEACGFKDCVNGRLFLELRRTTAKQGKHKGKTFDYYYLRCANGHEMKIHERQEDKALYHLNEWVDVGVYKLEPEETFSDSAGETLYLDSGRIAAMHRKLKEKGFVRMEQQLELIESCLGKKAPMPLLLTEDEARRIYNCALKKDNTEMQPKSFEELPSASQGYAS